MLRVIQRVKAVYCPKKMDFVLLEDCKNCEYFGGVERILKTEKVDCRYFEKVYGEEVDSNE